MPNRCYLCKLEEKTSNHLIFFCNKATMLWRFLHFLCVVGPTFLNQKELDSLAWCFCE